MKPTLLLRIKIGWVTGSDGSTGITGLGNAERRLETKASHENSIVLDGKMGHFESGNALGTSCYIMGGQLFPFSSVERLVS